MIPVLHMGTAAQTHLFKLIWQEQRFRACLLMSKAVLSYLGSVFQVQCETEVIYGLDHPCCSLKSPEDITHLLERFNCLPKMLKKSSMWKVSKGK